MQKDFKHKNKAGLTISEKKMWPDQLIEQFMQTVSQEKKKKKKIITVQMFRKYNNHTQQLPYSVCARCHAAKLNKITQKVLKKKSSIERNLRRKLLQRSIVMHPSLI